MSRSRKMPELSRKTKEISSSPIADQMALARTMLERGDDVIDLTVGETDANPSDAVKSVAVQAVKNDLGKYTPASGLFELKELLAKRYCTVPSRISVSNGAKSVLHVLMECLINPGDELLLPAPYWPCFLEAARVSGANVKIMPPADENRLLPSLRQFENAITEKTKIVLLNSPCNPSGQTYSKEELNAVLNLCREKDIFCLFDGSYSELYFDELSPADPLHLETDFSDIVICVGSASKAWAMSGWRIGWCIAPENVTEAVSKFLNNCIGSPSAISQIAFMEALKDEALTEQIRRTCKERCTYVANRIRNMRGLRCIPPSGGLYVFANIESGYDDIRFTKELLESMELATVAGSAFGCPGWFRISCSKELPVLETAMNRLEMFLFSKFR